MTWARVCDILEIRQDSNPVFALRWYRRCMVYARKRGLTERVVLLSQVREHLRKRIGHRCQDCDCRVSKNATRCTACMVKHRFYKRSLGEGSKVCRCGRGIGQSSKRCLSCMHEDNRKNFSSHVNLASACEVSEN